MVSFHAVERLLYHARVGVNHKCCVFCRWSGPERTRTRGVVPSFRTKNCMLRIFLVWLRCCFTSRSGFVLSPFVNGFPDREAPHK